MCLGRKLQSRDPVPVNPIKASLYVYYDECHGCCEGNCVEEKEVSEGGFATAVEDNLRSLQSLLFLPAST